MPRKLKTVFFLAFKGLLHKKLTSVLLIAAVMFGIGFQIPNMANLEGYTNELIRMGVTRFTGHIVITPSGTGLIDDVRRTKKRLESQPYIDGVAVRLIHAGVVFKKNRHYPTRIVGLEPENEHALNGFCSRVSTGHCISLKGGERELLVGGKLAEGMQLKQGDHVRLVLPYEELGEIEYAKSKFRVAGIMEGGGGFQIDRDIYVSIEVLYRMLNTGDAASVISAFVDDQSKSAAYAAELEKVVGNVQVMPWWEVDDFIKNAIDGNRTLSAVSMIMVILAVMIPVFALLYVHVLNERRQVAVMSAIGFSRGAVFRVYLFKVVIIGLVGIGCGIALGALLCQYFKLHPIFEYNGFVIHPELGLKVILLPSMIVLLVTLLAGLMPALKAACSNTSEQLRET
ncbi:MAG: FtsX-like permease family protein [Pseudomonadota bacterium]